MTQSIGMRATALAASSALLGAAVIVALTFTYALPAIDLPFDGPPVEMEIEPPAPPPVRPQTPITQTVTSDAEALEPLPDATQIADLEPVSSTSGDVGPPTVMTIERPHWLQRPANLQRYYPRRALDGGVQGDVVLDCLVRTSGYLACDVVSETPAGRGFADAALRIAADHRMTPATHNGVAVEGRYRMRVPFRVE